MDTSRYTTGIANATAQGKALADSLGKAETAAKSAQKAHEGFGGAVSALANDHLKNLNTQIGTLLEQLPLVGTVGGPAFEKMAEGAGSAGGAVGALTLGLGAALGIIVAVGAEALHLANEFGEAGHEIEKMQIITGLSAERLSLLRDGAVLSGKSLDDLQKPLQIYFKNLTNAAEGNDALAKKMLSMGITAKDAFRDPDLAVQQLFDHLSKIENPIQRTHDALTLMSKSGTSVLEIMEKMGPDAEAFKERMREIGAVMSQEDVDAANDFNRASRELGLAWEAAERSIAKGALPAIMSALGQTEGQIVSNREAWTELGVKMGEIVTVGLEVVGALDQVGRGLDTVYNKLMSAADAAHDYIAAMLGVQQASNYAPGASVLNPSDYAPGVSVVDPNQTYAGVSSPEFMAWMAAGKDPSKFGQQRPLYDPAEHTGGGKKGRKGGKGPDPESEQLKLHQIELKSDLDFYKQIEDAYKNSLDQRLSTVAEYVAKSKALNEEEHAAVLHGLNEEMDAAVALKKGSAVKQAEIALKMQQEDRRYAEQNTKYNNELHADELAQDKAFRDSKLQVQALMDQREIASIKELMTERLVTEEQGEQEIANIQIAALDRKEQNLVKELSLLKSGTLAYQQTKFAIAQVEVERGNLIASTTETIIAAHRKDLDDQHHYHDEVLKLNRDLEQSTVDLAKARLGQAVGLGELSPEQAKQGTAAIDAYEEQIKHQQNLDTLYSNWRVAMENQTDARRAQIAQKYTALIEAEMERDRQVQSDIQQRGLVEFQDHLKTTASDLTSILGTGVQDLFTNGWKSAFNTVEKGFLDMILKMEAQLIEKDILKVLQGLTGTGGGQSGNFFAGLLAKLFGIETTTMTTVATNTTAVATNTTASIALTSSMDLLTASVNNLAFEMSAGGSGGGGIGGLFGDLFGGGSDAAGMYGGLDAGGSSLNVGGITDVIPFFGEGGDYAPNQPFIAGEGGRAELVIPGGRPGTVLNQDQIKGLGRGGGDTYHFHINVPNIEAAGSRQTQRQVLNQMRAAVMKPQ